jgi:hypothetical protein
MTAAAIRSDLSAYNLRTIAEVDAEVSRCLALALEAHNKGRHAVADAWNYRARVGNQRRRELTPCMA